MAVFIAILIVLVGCLHYRVNKHIYQLEKLHEFNKIVAVLIQDLGDTLEEIKNKS